MDDAASSNSRAAAAQAYTGIFNTSRDRQKYWLNRSMPEERDAQYGRIRRFLRERYGALISYFLAYYRMPPRNGAFRLSKFHMPDKFDDFYMDSLGIIMIMAAEAY